MPRTEPRLVITDAGDPVQELQRAPERILQGWIGRPWRIRKGDALDQFGALVEAIRQLRDTAGGIVSRPGQEKGGGAPRVGQSLPIGSSFASDHRARGFRHGSSRPGSAPNWRRKRPSACAGYQRRVGRPQQGWWSPASTSRLRHRSLADCDTISRGRSSK